MATDLYNSAKHMFTIVKDDSGRLVMEAVCGTSGLSIVRHELSPDEVQLYHVDPESFAPVARRICNDWFIQGERDRRS